MAIGAGGRGGGISPGDNMETFAGQTLIANYAMVAHRHMHETAPPANSWQSLYGDSLSRHRNPKQFRL
ncbi:MAG: hypothetical protein CM15mP120_18410 [Pseudomonadota bacterium]|nr:MAG: hypothetical protein CM15mP120_18410 [Pseudomonadota bacterium]